MKIKVTLLLTVFFLLIFAATAHADSYDSGTGTLVVSTPWAVDLQTAVEAAIAPDTAADIHFCVITAGTVTATDAAYIDGSMTSLQTLSVIGTAVFTSTPIGFFSGDAVIESINIPVDFTRRFFANNCANLHSISLPSAIEIRNDSIQSNPLLNTLSLSNVVEIGYQSIIDNDSLETLELPAVIACYNGSLRDNDSLKFVSMPAAIYFEGAQFRNSAALEELSLPALEYLGPDAISGCPNLTSLSLPKVSAVYYDALRNNDSLASISLPLAFSFGERALSGNASLASVSLPAAEVFDIRVFQNNDSLTSVYIPNLDNMDDFAFNGVPNTITMELGATPPTAVTWTTFAAYSPAAMGAVVRVPMNQVDDYDAADGVDGDNMWYGWRIVGVSSPPVVNPLTGDDSIYIPWFVWTAALCAAAVVILIIRRKHKA